MTMASFRISICPRLSKRRFVRLATHAVPGFWQIAIAPLSFRSTCTGTIARSGRDMPDPNRLTAVDKENSNGRPIKSSRSLQDVERACEAHAAIGAAADHPCRRQHRVLGLRSAHPPDHRGPAARPLPGSRPAEFLLV